MALTLPYPGLDFVPLDILTAEEMNEIVANYTFIASQFPIGAGALDFANLYLEADSLSELVECPQDATTTIQTLSLPVGRWRVEYMMRGYGTATGNSGFIVTGGVYDGETTDHEVITNFASDGVTGRGEIVGSAMINVLSPATVTSRVNPAKRITVAVNAYLYALRVG